MKIYNFYAGPSFLHHEILQNAWKEIEKKPNELSLLEVSHRSDRIRKLFDETEQLIREIASLPNQYEILFLHGGASLQYCMIPYNLLVDKPAYFIDTGIWSSKAIHESSLIGESYTLSSSKDDLYNHIPKTYKMPADGSFLHITTNNTIYGTQYHSFPKPNFPLVADMSSDIFSRKLDFSSFQCIYAGFQKNLGTAGGCLVVIDKKILNDSKEIPSILNYRNHIKNRSMLNTPPVFAVLMCKLSLEWIKTQGGLDVVERNNRKKANELYVEIDRNELLTGNVHAEDRSMMNVTFSAINPQIETAFKAYCAKNNIVGIHGHRLAGGFRASIYNTLPIEHIRVLIDVMKEFERKFG